MRFALPLFLLALCAVSDAAVLVRFINTVPTRQARNSFTTFAAAAPPTPAAFTVAAAFPTTMAQLRVYGENGPNTAVQTNRVSMLQDRIGLFYYGDASSPISSPTIVQTQILEVGVAAIGANPSDISADGSSANAPFPWYHAMPSLRGYHLITGTAANPATAQTASPDLPFGSAGSINTIAASNHVLDYYESTHLRADGVGTYLSFAAGTYTYVAYSVMSGLRTDGTDPTLTTTATTSNLPFATFSNSKTSFTFVDGKVYTILAIGDGQYNANIPRTGATVRLVLLEESVAPVTFGMSALRFVHAITSQSDKAIDVYLGTALTTKVASSIAFGGVSDYIDQNPSSNAEYPVGFGSPATSIATGIPVQREVRAGSRVTVICAENNIQTGAVFCRGIPSRVVAYVRLIADTGYVTSVVVGKAGPQKLSETKLSLFASYEYPRPEYLMEQSQVNGASTATGAAPTLEGLYPVVQNVAADTASGYGEVHVPVHIMDFALRPVIGMALPEGNVATTAANIPLADFITAGAGTLTKHYWYAPLLKRVHFVVKTDGFATLGGRNLVRRNAFPAPAINPANIKTGLSLAAATPDAENHALHRAVTLDFSVEAGQFYSFTVSGSFSYNDDPAAAATGWRDLTSAVSSYQEAAIVKFGFVLDRSLATVAQSFTGTQGALVLYPVATTAVTQSGNGAPDLVSLTLPQRFATARTYTASAAASAFNTGRANTFIAVPASGSSTTLTIGTAAANAITFGIKSGYTAFSDSENLLVAGTYSYTFTLGAITTLADAVTAVVGADAYAKCFNNIPNSGTTIPITAGSVTDLFVFGAYACYTPTTPAAGAVSDPNPVALGSSDTTKLKVRTFVRQSAVASGHSPFAASTRAAAADLAGSDVEVPLYNAASSSVVSILFAAVLAAFAALAL